MSNNLITHNNFDLALATDENADNGVNSCITMASATNIDISNNRFNGGGYNIYFEGASNPPGGIDTTGCDVTNNVFAGHVYGYVAGSSEGAQNYSGNVYGDTTVSSGTSTTTTSTSPALVVTVDTVAPTAPSIATPTTNTNGGLNLTGMAEANSTVKVYDGTTEIGTATANSSGAWSYTTSTLATGSHSLTAKATDVAGNTGATSAVVPQAIAVGVQNVVGASIHGTAGNDVIDMTTCCQLHRRGRDREHYSQHRPDCLRRVFLLMYDDPTKGQPRATAPITNTRASDAVYIPLTDWADHRPVLLMDTVFARKQKPSPCPDPGDGFFAVSSAAAKLISCLPEFGKLSALPGIGPHLARSLG